MTTTTTTTTQQQKEFSEKSKPKKNHGETSEKYDQIEFFQEVNDHLYLPDKVEGIGGYFMKGIIENDWKLGQLNFKLD